MKKPIAMNKKYRHLLRATLAALPLACVAMLSSCSYDDYGECPDSDTPATVRVSVSAGEPGDLNGTRAGDDVNADEHEFMHTLYLCILDERGYVQEMFHEDDGTLQNLIAGEAAAATGDVLNWTSENFTLAPGTYTIYAFANVDGYMGENDQAKNVDVMAYLQDQFKRGGGVRTDLPNFRLNDPASKINFNEGKYIPMSAKETITVTSNTRDISIGLDRLVSKVQLTVPSAEYVSTNSTVQFSDYSQNVPLLGAEDGGYGAAQLYGGRTAETAEMPFSQPGEVVSFYVNETNTGDPFTVTFNTGKSGNGDVSAYVAKTQRTDIPRNSIYPLSLTFPDFTPQFEWQSWEAAIGSVPVEVVVEEENYIVKIASGNTFEFSVTGVQGGTLTEATWRFGEDVSTKITNIQNNGATIGGAISAGVSVGEQIPLTVTVDWTGPYTDPSTGTSTNRNFTRTYNVTIETISIWGTEHKRNTRSGSWSAYRLAPEVLNMFKR